MVHRFALSILLFAAALAATPGSVAAEGPPARPAKPLTVVELFTSQGCSSCPPADAYLGELARRSDVLALSLHVDYWNYIGWADPFASARYSERQRAYARAFELRSVYTPQMVVDGLAEAVGSHRGTIEALIRRAAMAPKAMVTLRRGAGGLITEVGAAGPRLRPALAHGADVWLVGIDRRTMTDVPRGENRGRSLVNHNVARHWQHLGTWDGKTARFPAPLPEGAASEELDMCAVLIQARIASGAPGRILGAAQLDLPMAVERGESATEERGEEDRESAGDPLARPEFGPPTAARP